MITGFYTDITRNKNMLQYRGYDADGAKVYEKFKFRPTMYVESKNTDTKWKSLEGLALDPMRFDSMSDCRAFMKQYEDVSSFKIFGNDRHIPAFIQAEFPGEIKYKPELIDVVTLDIECKSDNGFPEPSVADQELTLIGLKSSRLGHYITWGTKPYDSSKSVLPHLKKEYRYFKNEVAMLEDFLTWWSDLLNCPDVITGWNTRFFDVPYLINRIARIFDHDAVKRLSPWGVIEQKTIVTMGKEQFFFNIHGIQQLDYMELFKKFTYTALESYRLDFVAETVLGENKIHVTGLDNAFVLLNENGDEELKDDLSISDVDLTPLQRSVRLRDRLRLEKQKRLSK